MCIYVCRSRSHWGPLWLRHRITSRKRRLMIGVAVLGECLWCCVTLICFCRVVWSLVFVFLEGALWNCCGERLCQECRVHLDYFSDCSLVDVVTDMLYVQLAPSILRFILTDASKPRAPPFSSKWVTEPQKLGQYDTKVQSVCNSIRFGEKQKFGVLIRVWVISNFIVGLWHWACSWCQESLLLLPHLNM